MDDMKGQRPLYQTTVAGPPSMAGQVTKRRRVRSAAGSTEPRFFTSASSRRRRLFDVEDIQSRRYYGRLLIWGYIGLIALMTLGPLLLWAAVSTWGDPIEFRSGFKALQDFVIALLASLSGVAGMAGFVVGRFFAPRGE